jgi:hypothetical protein
MASGNPAISGNQCLLVLLFPFFFPIAITRHAAQLGAYAANRDRKT